MFLLIDNFDSFTYNLVQSFQKLGKTPTVLRNDRPELLDIVLSGNLDMVCISRGPSHPVNAGLCLEFLNRLPRTVPVLGVCLGHQNLRHFAGATVNRAERIMHGKTSLVRHTGKGLFEGLPETLEVCRYHSLLVRAEEAPDKLAVTAWTDDNEVMGLQWKDRPWAGVQFHPESIFTPRGLDILANFPEALAS